MARACRCITQLCKPSGPFLLPLPLALPDPCPSRRPTPAPHAARPLPLALPGPVWNLPVHSARSPSQVRSILLRGFDQQMANLVGEHLEKRGVKFIRQCVPTELQLVEDGPPRLVKVSAAPAPAPAASCQPAGACRLRRFPAARRTADGRLWSVSVYCHSCCRNVMALPC